MFLTLLCTVIYTEREVWETRNSGVKQVMGSKPRELPYRGRAGDGMEEGGRGGMGRASRERQAEQMETGR